MKMNKSSIGNVPIVNFGKMNKRGGIGDFIAMMISTIIIVLILGGFILASGVFTKFAEKPTGAKVYGEAEGEKDFFVYMNTTYVQLRREVFENAKEVHNG